MSNQNERKPAALLQVPLPCKPNGKPRCRVGRSRWMHLECQC